MLKGWMVSVTTLLLVALTATVGATDIYVLTDDHAQSERLERFCENRLSDIAIEVTPRVLELDAERDRIIGNITLIRDEDIEAKKKHGVPSLNNLPKYRIGRYGVWKEFDPRVWESMAFLPAYFQYIIDEFHYDETVIAHEERIIKYKRALYFQYMWMEQILYTFQVDTVDREWGPVIIIIDYDDLLKVNRLVRVNNPGVPVVPLVAPQPPPILKNPLDAISPAG